MDKLVYKISKHLLAYIFFLLSIKKAFTGIVCASFWTRVGWGELIFFCFSFDILKIDGAGVDKNINLKRLKIFLSLDTYQRKGKVGDQNP